MYHNNRRNTRQASNGMEHQTLLAIQQNQLEIQLQQMRMANMALQEQIYAQQAQYVMYNPLAFTAPASADAQAARRGALHSLQRAQLNRDAATAPNSATSVGNGFPGGFAQAQTQQHPWMAKRMATTPVPTIRDTGAVTPALQAARAKAAAGHRRQASSTSTVSHTSKSSGPTVVLSRPGETYSPPRITTPTSESASSSTDSDSASESDVRSFDSCTSVDTSPSCESENKPTLNPAASSFVPLPTLGFPHLAHLNNGNRSVSAPARVINKNAAVPNVIRQPRGPPGEEDPEYASKNFASRIRKAAVANLLIKGAARSPVFAEFPRF